ncbi:MAG: phosphopantetheine-binding protein [Syntrophales bacterium]|nr:phosphopantetheine-binding protein [Syntrophales bacterium]MCK9527604.1 phosphopantetheine-binding protein [Syntrophales bacterium]MDX9922221.1 phosphopantetheine-binding protein [Syntrophales bacterium]
MDDALRTVIKERAELLRRLKQSLIERLNLYQTVEQIDDDTPLFGMGLRLDSIDATEVIAILDAEFGVQSGLNDGADPAFMRTINTLVDFIIDQKKYPLMLGR